MLHKPCKVITQDNGTINIYGNNHLRPFEYYYQLSEKDKKELDWIEDDDAIVLHYKGNVIALDEFMSLHNPIYEPNPPQWMKEYDGYTNDSFFSGLLIKIDKEDSEWYKIYTFIS